MTRIRHFRLTLADLVILTLTMVATEWTVFVWGQIGRLVGWLS